MRTGNNLHETSVKREKMDVNKSGLVFISSLIGEVTCFCSKTKLNQIYIALDTHFF